MLTEIVCFSYMLSYELKNSPAVQAERKAPSAAAPSLLLSFVGGTKTLSSRGLGAEELPGTPVMERAPCRRGSQLRKGPQCRNKGQERYATPALDFLLTRLQSLSRQLSEYWGKN